MKLFWKYILWILSFATLVMYYLLYTSLGHGTVGYLLGDYLSKKTGNQLEIYNLKLDNYPVVSLKVKINGGAEVSLYGKASRDNLDMDYHLKGDALHYKSLVLNDKMNIKGNISGSLSNILVTGQGEVFEGKVQFNVVKTPKYFKDMNINLTNVNAKKVLTFLHKKPMVEGKADIDLNFKHYEKYHNDGEVLIYMKKATIPSVVGNVPLALKMQIKLLNIEYFYDAGIKSEIGTCIISDGYYHQTKKEAKLHYVLDLKELSHFKNFFKHTYNGGFLSAGIMKYENKKLSLVGTTKQFGGLAEYTYNRKRLGLTL